MGDALVFLRVYRFVVQTISMEHVSKLLPAIVPADFKALTPIQHRLNTMPTDVSEQIIYQHSVLCQTVMPYRNPGDDIRIWHRVNGRVKLLLEAGHLLDPSTDKFVKVGLPYGPKPRLVLFHLHAEALRTESPLIELEDSLTAFVSRTLGLDKNGRNIRAVKDQLNRLAGTRFCLGMSDGIKAVTVQGVVFNRIELWTPRDERQRTLWPTTVQFSRDYFDSLTQHAVPLTEEAVARLSHSAMGLDAYTWLAERLHRVHPRKPAFVPWVSLKEQFGEGYGRMVDFRRVFERTLCQVKAVYPHARFITDQRGMWLRNSPPPVPPRYCRGLLAEPSR
jgi:hypothetical protein